ncbi:MAG: hypothetical protein WCD31_10545, partial [Gillisia sp.]
LMQSFQSRFSHNMMPMNGADMNNFFGKDSTFMKQFMNGGDFFQNDSLADPNAIMARMRAQMQAMQQQFLQQQHQPIIPADPKYNQQG